MTPDELRHKTDSLRGTNDPITIAIACDLLYRAADEIEHLTNKVATYRRIIWDMEMRPIGKRSQLHQTDYNVCADGGPHRFPNPWYGTMPPNCTLCGRRSG